MAVVQLNVDFVQKTLETVLDVRLSGVGMTQLHGGLEIPLLASSGESQDQSLASLTVVSVRFYAYPKILAFKIWKVVSLLVLTAKRHRF